MAKSASHSGPRVCGWEDNDCYSAGARNTDDTTQHLLFSSFEKVSHAFPLSFLLGDVSAAHLTKNANQASACWCEMSLSSAHFWRVFLFLGVQSALEPQNNGRKSVMAERNCDVLTPLGCGFTVGCRDWACSSVTAPQSLPTWCLAPAFGHFWLCCRPAWEINPWAVTWASWVFREDQWCSVLESALALPVLAR